MNSLRFRAMLLPLIGTLILHALPPLSLVTAQDEVPADRDDEPRVREQTIYVPFSKLREVFEKEGRGVFLPYEQFQELWESARKAETGGPRDPTAKQPPVDAIISKVTSEATVREDVVQVDATLTIELLKTGWNTVPLRLGDGAIQTATIDDTIARVTAAKDGGYQLVVENTEDQPVTIELKMTYLRAFSKSPGQNSVSFAAPQAPVNRWRIRVPGSGVKVNVTPMIAATQQEPEERGPEESDPASEETVLLAFVGSASEVSIRWTAKSEGASGLTALTSVQAAQEVYLAEGSLRTRATLDYSISRSPIERLVVEVPADQKIVNVFDPNVRRWEVEGGETTQTITVDLFEPASSRQRLTIELEQFIDESMMEEIHSPMIRAMEVARQQGTLVLRADPTLRVDSRSREGLLQVDASELPATLANQSWTLSYRYASTPFDLTIAAEKIQPRINVQQLVEYYLEPEQLSVDSVVIYDIQQAGVFELELNLPVGYEVLQVRGVQRDGVAAAAVDSFRIEGSDNDRLVIDLTRKAMGKIGLVVQLRKGLSDANLLAPTGNVSTIAMPIPEAMGPFRNQFAGRVVVYAPVSLRLNPSSLTGLRAVSFNEAFAEVPSSREGRFSTTRPTLAFAFSEQATDLQLDVERRSPYVTARQMLVVRIDSGVVKFDATVFYEILYSGVKSLRIDFPSEVAPDVRNVSDTLRDAAIDPQPDDVAEGYVAWKLTGESELIGVQRVHLTWEQKIDELAVGESVDLSVPRIVPMMVDRAWGQIVVTKTETLDVRATEDREGLRPIDPVQDIMPDARVADAAAAMEFYDPWRLTLVATRYQLEAMKRTSIERALVRTVVTRSGQRTVDTLYRIRSVRQRLSIKLPEDAAFDSQPARVNGSPVSLERGDQDLLYIPLIGQDPNREFVLELRYTVAGDQRQIDLPEFPEDPALQKVYLAVFLPTELALLNKSGPWTEEFQWTQQGSSGWTPAPNSTDEALEAWVREGIASGTAPAFQKDGTMYLYSALRPDPPPDGNLKLTAVNENLLAGLVTFVLAIVGVLLLRRTLTQKLAAVVLLLIAAVLCGLFAPTFGLQLLGVPTYAGLTIVFLAWGAWTLTQQSKRLSWKKRGRANETLDRPAGDPSDVETPDDAAPPDRAGDDASGSNGGDGDE